MVHFQLLNQAFNHVHDVYNVIWTVGLLYNPPQGSQSNFWVIPEGQGNSNNLCGASDTPLQAGGL